MIVLRMLVGGMHRPTFWQCFFMTAGWVFGGMIVGSVGIKNSNVAIVLMVVTLIVIMKTGIAPSSKHRRLSEKSKRKRMYIAVLLEMMFVVLMALVRNPIVRSGIFGGTLITNLQVSIRRLRE